ncbi:hypothetical protein [Rhodovarius sp.]|uniref:hypothetical protein n=1 Tax=Rhodovarius sp. TaxID=2972673 RepID=UPI0033422A3D
MPPLGRLLRTALILGAVPLLVQLVLLLTEEVSTRSAILAMLAGAYGPALRGAAGGGGG